MKTLNQEIAEKVGRDFAQEHNRSINDPIVKDLIRGCKLSLGATVYRNRLKAERLKNQIPLFTTRSNKSIIQGGKL